MTTIRLTIDIDVGDHFSPANFQLDPELVKGLTTLEQVNLRNALIGDALGYDYVGYVTAKHFEDALEWCALGKVGSPEEVEGAKLIMEHHQLWGKIAKTAKFSWVFI